ncbi:MAG: hypothetical protein LIP77_00525 [Planctomycetes bacterium]|nr:hypothetical protein [Planctomycetota bacterium]
MNALRNRASLVVTLVVTLAVVSAAVAGEEEPAVSAFSPAATRYFDIAENLRRRCLDGASTAIRNALAVTSDDDALYRLRLARALLLLGPEEWDTALTALQGWDFSPTVHEAERLTAIGDACLRFLDQPGQAVAAYEEALRYCEDNAFSGLQVVLVNALFSAYASHPDLFDSGRMQEYLLRHQMLAVTPRTKLLVIARGIYAGSLGNDAEARAEARYLDQQAGDGWSGRYVRFLGAEIWGWLGDVEKVVSVIEPHMVSDEANGCSRQSFRAQCDFLRKSPAYDAIRDDERFIALWERLAAYEPPAQCDAP